MNEQGQGGHTIPQPRSPTLTLAVVLAFMSLPSSLLAQRPLGVDVSHYQGTVTWTSVKNSGVSFGWAKSTEGTGTTDAYFDGNVSGAKAAG